MSIVSYNHLGNNDGKNLSAPKQFRSKEISKSNVVDDMVESNKVLYKEGEHPDHTVSYRSPPSLSNIPFPPPPPPPQQTKYTFFVFLQVVIKYVPYVGDSKRAMDEYTSEIFMGGTNTVVLHNTCEDSLLAAPIILDLVIVAELAERILIKKGKIATFNIMA